MIVLYLINSIVEFSDLYGGFMKKTYVLLSIMVLALMTAGFSYAYWTDTLTVSGTAATGDLEVLWDDDYTAPSSWVGSYEYLYRGTPKGPDTFVVESDSTSKNIVATFANLHPGSITWGVARFYNAGSIPAQLTGLNLHVSGSGEDSELDTLIDNTELWIFLMEDQFFNTYEWIPQDAGPVFGNQRDGEVIQLSSSQENYNYIMTDNSLEDYPFIMEVEDTPEYSYFWFAVLVNPNLETAMDKSLTFEFSLGFDQWNNPENSPND
mgnify:CR=1 FL=1